MLEPNAWSKFNISILLCTVVFWLSLNIFQRVVPSEDETELSGEEVDGEEKTQW